MKIKLVQNAMGQLSGSVLDVSAEVARLLITRGAAVAEDQVKQDDERRYPERNKSMSARQAVKG